MQKQIFQKKKIAQPLSGVAQVAACKALYLQDAASSRSPRTATCCDCPTMGSRELAANSKPAATSRSGDHASQL
ncbi:UNVERIFIED_CONTAM: hypothetical protein Sradi_3314200 [Sesamum radiatum]|uniref:Uncharacterized protein n=1 Tax=Sesamum radiatum TaxID=300843 RepID=A0AAW2R1J7_SESRA